MTESETVRDSEDEGSGLFAQIPAILWQRRWWIFVPLVASSLLGALAAYLLPTYYRATAVLLVQSPQLPADLVGPAYGSLIDKRIAKIRQQVLSRPDLVELIQTNNLYASQRTREPLSTVVERMRKATTISPIAGEFAKDDRGSNTVAFSLTFEYPEAQQAQIVAQDFVDRLLKLDSSQTAEQASQTVDFLQEEATRLAGQLTNYEQQIETLKAANGATLAGTSIVPTGGGGYEAQIAGLQRENAQLTSQLSLFSSASQRDPNVLAAQAALAQARATYSDGHPDVALAQQRLAQAKQLAGQNPLPVANEQLIRTQIAANNATIGQLAQARASEQARTTSALTAQARAPLVLEQISQLQAKAEGIRTNYQAVSTNLMNAQNSARLSSEQKGERLTLVDPPVAPEKPFWPNRPLVVIGGIVLGAFLGLVLALGIEVLRSPIRGIRGVERITGAVPLVAIPVLSRKPARKGLLSRFVRRRALSA